MTIRQVLLNYSSAGVGSSISYVGAASATTTSVTPPTHTTGDVLIAYATGTSAITLPAGWTSIGSNSFGTSPTAYVRCAYKVAASGSETSGTWTGASRLTIVNYRGVASVQSAVFWNGTTTIRWSAVSLTVTDGTSWVVGLATQSGGNGNTNPPTGMTYRTSVDTNRQVVYDTASGVSSWSQKTTSSESRDTSTYMFELVSA